jgi:hypothetical protein
MSKSLGAFLFVKSGEEYDYPYKEVIRSLCELCDQVSVVGFIDDGMTTFNLIDLKSGLYNLKLQLLPAEDWNKVQGKEKLAYFQNIAASALETDYQLLCQADELITPESYPYIGAAMEEGGEGYLCTRINLWKDANHMLNVPHHRKPCSTEVNRLTKRGYASYDDGENIGSQTSDKYLHKIIIFHYGFIRKKEVHPEKIRNMQQNIFLTTPDSKLEGMGDFEWDRWFSEDDLMPIGNLKHPPHIQEWIKTRP